jgi:N-acetylmuramoyl-L-alanine amidase
MAVGMIMSLHRQIKLLSGLFRHLMLLPLVLFLAVAGGQAMAADNAVTALRLGSVMVDDEAALRLVVETQKPAIVKMGLLNDPYRLVVDMPGTDWLVEGLPAKGALNKSPVIGYRFGHPEPEIGRLVLVLDGPSAPFRAFALPPHSGGHRLVIDMRDSGKTAFQVAAKALRDSKPIQFGGDVGDDVGRTQSVAAIVTPPVPKPRVKPSIEVKPATGAGETVASVPLPKQRPNRWLVFIDAGHGGKDPGAIGRAGTKEKEITLAAARELARRLTATGKVRAVLSRSDDRYLKLRERIRLARRQNADLFISLHADSAESKSARGMSVFTLSETASDKEAAALARNENSADLIGGPDLAVEDADAANELLRMFQRESMNQSTHFAEEILIQIRDLPGGDKRGHRFAGFAVLKAPDMPSVLVEMGFLSNREDEANLNKAAYRAEIAARLTKAVVAYLEEYGPKI